MLDKDIKVNFSEEEMVFIHFFKLEINWMAQFPHKACVLKIWERRESLKAKESGKYNCND